MTKAPQKHPMDETADKGRKLTDMTVDIGSLRESSDQSKPIRVGNSKGYWVVQYLKQPEMMGVWDIATMRFPSEDEAHAYADTLREGRHAAISVTHKDWE